MLTLGARKGLKNFLQGLLAFLLRPSLEVRLVRAARHGCSERVLCLIDAHGWDVRTPLTPWPRAYSRSLQVFEKQITLLHLAAESGNLSLVDGLVARGAVIEAITSWGHTPIQYAAARGHAVVVAWLASRGGDVNRPIPAHTTYCEDFVGVTSVDLLQERDVVYTGHEHVALRSASLDEILPPAATPPSSPSRF